MHQQAFKYNRRRLSGTYAQHLTAKPEINLINSSHGEERHHQALFQTKKSTSAKRKAENRTDSSRSETEHKRKVAFWEGRVEITEPVAIVEVLVLGPDGVVDVGGPALVASDGPPGGGDLRRQQHHGAH